LGDGEWVWAVHLATRAARTIKRSHWYFRPDPSSGGVL